MGKQIFKMLLYAIIFWVIIGGFIIICSYLLFANSEDHIAYDITQASIVKPNLPKAQAAIIPDAAHGKVLFQQCMVCHSLSAGAVGGIGPNLSQIVGRKIASQKNFYYSAAMQDFANEHKTWSPALLDKYLTAPQGVVPGNRMGFQGITEEKK
ncbi:MAG: c-type cytochrome [Alphaproteobacteria bacterium]|nr:c-type cytochrome [Alphaproteobacteria bacterium]